MDLLVMAKEPCPGRVKTRLCPPCSPAEAAALAAAALADTLDAACRSGADQVVLALDGRPGDWMPCGVRVVSQGTGALDRRLACAWSSMRGPTVQIGMDTPQVSSALLDEALDTLGQPGIDAAIGPADDGGWWAVGMARPDPQVFVGVPVSRRDTGALQRSRLREHGFRIHDLPSARDVDDIEDARAVAAAAPTTEFARTLHRLGYSGPRAR